MSKGSLQNPTGIKVGGSAPRRKSRGAWPAFWTEARDAKLLYVLKKYKDPYKAARVLAVPVKIIFMRLYELRRQGKAPARFD